MTSSNSGPGGGQDPAKAQETAQWWATPPAGTDAGQPVTGADPTMLNYAAAAQQFPPANPQQSQPGYPQQPAPGYGQQSSPGYPQQSAPGYPQQSAPAYAQQSAPGYAQQSAPGFPQQAQPGFQQPFPGQAPTPGYNSYPTPPRNSGSKAGLIIAGVIGLVVIVGVVIGIVAFTHKDSPISPLSDDKKKAMNGNYSMANITNACSVIDPSALTKWSSTQKGNPEHSETQPSDYAGGRMSCTAEYYSNSTTDKYTQNTARIQLDVEYTGAYGGPQYDSWKQYDTGTTGSGRTSGDVSGLGTEAYWHAETRDYSSFNDLDYTVATKDSNVSVKVEISLQRGSGESVSKDDVAAVAKQQVQKALDGMKK
ncbi:hypothetical protein [Nocardia sp. NPDC020380]|uniref:hypothetical protein n=1 Tax=Nocardia sp. NPDC020380 TaxID=3364309 RepID=UPI00378EF994